MERALNLVISDDQFYNLPDTCGDHTMDSETVSATEFKAKCLDFLDRVNARQISRLEITKRGKLVAVLIPPASQPETLEQLHGFLRDSVIVPEAVDLTAPVLDEPLNAEAGGLGDW